MATKRRRWQDAQSFRKNPGGTKSFIREFERKLVARFNGAKEPLINALESSRSLESVPEPTPAISLPQMTRKTYDITQTLFNLASAYVAQTSAESYLRGSEFAAQNARTIGIKVVLPSEGGSLPADWRVIDVIQSRNLAALKGITDDMSKEIIRTISEGIQHGDGVDVIRRAMVKTVDNIGVTRAKTLARTEVMNAWNTGAVTRFRQYGVEKVEWVTGTDEKVCEECAPLDGKKWPIAEAPQAPLHPNCRCILIAVPEGESQEGES